MFTLNFFAFVESHGVIHVMPNNFYKLQTTRSWDYLGLSPRSPSNLLHKTNMGEDVILGIFDTGFILICDLHLHSCSNL